MSSGFLAYDLLPVARVLYPVLSKVTPMPVEWWNVARGGLLRRMPDGSPTMSRWPLKRRHAHLVRKRICHYDDGDVHTGTLHCFCGEHEQGREYGKLARVQHRALQRLQGQHEVRIGPS